MAGAPGDALQHADNRVSPPKRPRQARRVRRGGVYLRVANPGWADPFDTTFSRRAGGRWNPPGSFGALYLNRDIRTAWANARRFLTVHGGFSLFDLKPERRPVVIRCTVSSRLLANALTEPSLTALGLPAEYPWQVGWNRCQPIGARLQEAGEDGVAARSAAECSRPGEWVGEEAVLFEPVRGVRRGRVLRFDPWYSVR